MNILTKPIPITLITGFLGAGKTSLLNQILKSPHLKDTAVIVNEFGEVGIDHLLVEEAQDGVIELSNGCLCCTMRGDLIDSLAGLVDRLQIGKIKHLERVIIETTGLADPAPILQALLGHYALIQSFYLDGVLTVIDAKNGHSTLKKYPEAKRQVAFADRILLSKTDLLDKNSNINLLLKHLHLENPTAKIIDLKNHLTKPLANPIANEDFFNRHLLNIGGFSLANKGDGIKDWLHLENNHTHEHEHEHEHEHDVNRHDSTVKAFSLTHNLPIHYANIEAFIDLLRSQYGDKILRFKAIIAVREYPNRPMILHGVQNYFSPPFYLEKWPITKQETRMVIIGDGLDSQKIQALFDAFLNKPSIDQADKAAIFDNPLSIPGLKL